MDWDNAANSASAAENDEQLAAGFAIRKQCSITDLCLRSVVHLATDLATDPHCAIDMHGELLVVLGRLIDQAKYCTTDPKRHDDGLGELRQRAVFI